MKISTRTGDDGTTGLLGPGRVFKDALRVEAYGSVDELNAVLGVVHALDAGNWLAASAPDAVAQRECICDEDVAALERWIDRLEAELEPLTSFVLPGGSPLGAQLHVARAVCRRAERRTVSLLQSESVQPRLVRYLNRLGDLLFVMARWCNRRAGAPETEWHPRRS
jgi:cob(I)alamin adenosyltransferase